MGLVLVGPETKGERIIIKGHVYDGAGDPLKDAIEIWQADAEGFYNSPQERRADAPIRTSSAGGASRGRRDR